MDVFTNARVSVPEWHLSCAKIGWTLLQQWSRCQTTASKKPATGVSVVDETLERREEGESRRKVKRGSFLFPDWLCAGKRLRQRRRLLKDVTELAGGLQVLRHQGRFLLVFPLLLRVARAADPA